MLTQRLGSDTQKDPAFIDAFINIVRENPGSCDEVWFATDYGYPPISTHKATAAYLADAAVKMRKAGIRVSLQISNTIGHGQYMAQKDNTGLVFEGSPVEHLVGHDGTTAPLAFCWYGKHFREYIAASLRDYIRCIKPYRVWADDDLRATNHAPVTHGCFCDDCMARFNRKYASSFTREELVHEISFGDLIWRERHIEFLREGIGDFTAFIGGVIHESCPDTAMGYQYGPYGEYTGVGVAHILDAMYKSTGHPPATRPGAGSYNDHYPSTFVDKSETLDSMNRTLPDYATEIRPEIESLPDIVFGKSIGGTCFETSYYLASGATAMSYAILMNDYESMDWHGKMLHAFSEHRAYWERLSHAAIGTKQAGFAIAFPREGWRRPCDTALGYQTEFYGFANSLRYLGISVAMKQEIPDDEVRLLDARNVEKMSDEELCELLHDPVVTDAEAVHALAVRGISLPVAAEPIDTSLLCERFTDHPVNKGRVHRRWNGQFGRSGGSFLRILAPDRTEILSEYLIGAPNDTPDSECTPVANAGIMKYRTTGKCASAVITTEYGARWAIFAFDFWHRGVSTEKRDQYLDAAAYISGHRQPAELLTPIQALLQSRVNEQGQLTHTSITNATVGDSGPLTVRVYKPASLTAVYMGQYHEAAVLPLTPTDTKDVYTVTVPDVKAWSVATLFF